MAKNNLEQILLEASKNQEVINKLVENSTKDVLKSTMSEEINSFVKAALTEEVGDEELETANETGEDLDDEVETSDEGEDSEEEYSEEDVDMDTEEDSDDMDDMDMEDEFEDSDEEGEGMDMTSDDDMDLDMDTETDFDMNMDTEDGDIDMENASVEDLLRFLEDSNLPVGQEVTVTKNNTFKIGSPASKLEPMGEGKKGNPMKKAPKTKLSEVKAVDEEMNENEKVFEIEMEDDEAKEIQEMLRREKKALSENRKVKRTNPVNENADKFGKMKAQITKLINLNDSLIRENKSLKSENAKMTKLNESAAKALQSSENNLKKLALTNTNLALVTRLFTENTTTKEQKMKILEGFDKSKSPEQSKRIFAKLDESLKSRKNTPINENEKSGIAEAAQSKAKTNDNKKVIKESEVKIAVDAEQERLLNLMNYKSKH